MILNVLFKQYIFLLHCLKQKKTDSITVKLCEICKNYMQEYHNYHKINHKDVPQVCL